MTESTYSGNSIRRNAWHYLSGKAVSGLITFFVLLWLVRVLPLHDYGVLVTFIATVELGYAIAGMGLQWAAVRYLPEFQLQASGSQLKRIILILLGWQSTAFLVAGALCLTLGSNYLYWVNLSEYRDAGIVFIGVMFFEGLGRFAREPIMGPLMLQGMARVSLVFRQLSYFVLLLIFDLSGELEILDVAIAELLCSAAALLIALWFVNKHCAKLHDQTTQEGWTAPTNKDLWHTARSMYFAHMVSLTYSPQVLANLIVKWLGTESVAIFGFLRSLNDQISRYLPATLLMSLLRPKMVASHVSGNGVAAISSITNLAGKLSLFVLAPFLIVVASIGDSVIFHLSGGALPAVGGYAFGLMLSLVPFSQRHLLESAAVTLGRSTLCLHASLSGLAMLPLTWLLLEKGLGLWGPIAAIVAGHLLFNAIVLAALVRQERYFSDWRGFLKLLASSVATFAMAIWLTPRVSVLQIHPIWIDIGLTLTVGVIFLAAAHVFRPFTPTERATINRMVKAPVFIW